MTVRIRAEHMGSNRRSVRRWAVIAGVIGVILLEAAQTEAQVASVIWRATIGGRIGIQDYDQKLNPQMDTARFKTKDVLQMALGGTPTVTETLALNFEVQPTGTNIFLSVFDTASRTTVVRITAGERTTIFQDNKTLIFDVDAPINPLLGSALAGGRLRISGQGKVVSGVPSGLRANVEGILIDARPGDVGGTTGLLMQTKLKTSGKPLRILPASGP